MVDAAVAAPASIKSPAKERSLYLDALRGYAIILVVLGHVIQRTFGIANFFDKVNGSAAIPKTWWTVALLSFGYWHMPLFMGISGFLTYGHIKRPVGGWLNRKAALLLVPFLSWMTVYYWVSDRFLLKGKSFVDFVYLTVLHPGNGLWYFAVLFIFYVFAAIAETTGTGEWGLLAIGVILAALPTSSLVAVDQMQIVWIAFALGYTTAKYREQLFPWRFYIAGAATIAYPLSLYWYSHWHADSLLPVVRLTGVIVSCALVYLAVRFLRAGQPLAFLGKRTLEIYAAQFVFTSLPIWNGWGRVAVVTLLSIAGSIFVAWLLRREPLLDTLFYGGRHSLKEVTGSRRKPEPVPEPEAGS